MNHAAVTVVLLSPKPDLASILESSGDPISLHRSTTSDEALENLARRRVDILCIDGDHPGTTAFLRRVPLKQLVKCYFVICVTSRAAVRRRFEKQDVQYIATHSDSAAQVPHFLKFCIGLLRMERRHKPRLAVLVPAMVSDPKSEACFRATITELSETGCRLMTQTPIEVSAELNLSLVMQSGLSMMVSARVMWSDGHGQAGLAFTYIAPAQYLDYRGWLADLTAGRPLSTKPGAGKSAASQQQMGAEGIMVAAAQNFGDFQKQ